MKNMSKVLVFALACLLAGALLTGCMNSGGRTLGATPHSWHAAELCHARHDRGNGNPEPGRFCRAL